VGLKTPRSAGITLATWIRAPTTLKQLESGVPFQAQVSLV